MEEKKIYNKNSEILYLYDCKLCNPNGDPDDENKPRMDYETGRNLVSDVRLKRYFRDYFAQKGMEIFVGLVDGKSVTATDRLKKLLEKYGKDSKVLSKPTREDIEWIVNQLVDVRLFGATMPIKAEGGGAGSSITFTGPVQFNWGYSLNKATIVPSNSITSHFSSDKKNTQGAMGKDYRLYYSLIAFYGIISAARAKETFLTDEDVAMLDEALIKAIPLTATSRSKNNQMPRLVLRVEYKENMFIGDLRRYLKLIPKVKEEEIRDLVDFEIDADKVVEILTEHKGEINLIKVCQDKDLMLKGGKTLKRMLIEKGIEENKIQHFNIAS